MGRACSHHAFCTLLGRSLDAHPWLSLTLSVWATRACVTGSQGLCPWSGAAVTHLLSPVGGSHAPCCPAPRVLLCTCPLMLRCKRLAHVSVLRGGPAVWGSHPSPAWGTASPPGEDLGDQRGPSGLRAVHLWGRASTSPSWSGAVPGRCVGPSGTARAGPGSLPVPSQGCAGACGLRCGPGPLAQYPRTGPQDG